MIQEPKAQKRTRYTVEPRLYPKGPLLYVKDAKGQLIYRIIRKSISPTCYSLQPLNNALLTSFSIKPKNLNGTRWYTLYEKDHEQLSLRYFPLIGELQLRDSQQNTLAKFIPFSPTRIQLRTSYKVIARLHHTQYFDPIHFRIVYNGASDDSWFFAFLLYSVALVEEAIILHQTTKARNDDTEKRHDSLQP